MYMFTTNKTFSSFLITQQLLSSLTMYVNLLVSLIEHNSPLHVHFCKTFNLKSGYGIATLPRMITITSRGSTMMLIFRIKTMKNPH